MLPKMTIVTASFNSAKTIRQTIESVVNQTYSNIEYIVIDGGSTDGTVDILREYRDKIAFWISEPDKGIYDAFNKGVMHATGDYVLFLGSDDSIYEVSTVERVVNELSAGEIDILSAGVWVVDGQSGLEKFMDGTKAGTVDYDYNMIPHQGMFTRRELLLRHPFDTSYRIAADYLFFLTCYFDPKIKIKYISTPVAFFAQDGVSGDTDNLQYMAEKECIRNIFNLSSEGTEGRKKSIRNKIKYCLKVMHIFGAVRYLYNRYVRCTVRKHRCDWPECRWCFNRRG